MWLFIADGQVYCMIILGIRMQDPHTKEVVQYLGWDESFRFILDYIALHGPFDGFWAFSQVHLCARAIIACSALAEGQDFLEGF
jgi:hypothetical protein